MVFLAALAAFWGLGAVWAHVAYQVDYPRSHVIRREGVVDTTLVRAFEQKKPELVLLGNSMLGEGIDGELFDSLVPEPSQKVSIGGAASAIWYLIFKNVLCEVDSPPRRVVVFFRDEFLTRPAFRVDGTYRAKVDRFAGPAETTLDRLAYLQGMSGLEYRALQTLPLYGERVRMREAILGVGKFGLPKWLAGADSSRVEQAIERVFADEMMDPGLLTAAQLAVEETGSGAGRFDLEAVVGDSFLPEIVKLADDHGIELLMVRVKKRRDLKPGERSAALEKYNRDLEAWLSDRGIDLLDYSDRTELTEEHYADGDHLNEAGRELFTRLVAADYLACLQREDRR